MKEKTILRIALIFASWFFTMAVISTIYTPFIDGIHAKNGLVYGIDNQNGSYEFVLDSTSHIVEGVVFDSISDSRYLRKQVHYGQVAKTDTIYGEGIRFAVDSAKQAILQIKTIHHPELPLPKKIFGYLFLFSGNPDRIAYMTSAKLVDTPEHNLVKSKNYVNFKLLNQAKK